MMEIVNEATEYVIKNFCRKIHPDGDYRWYYEIHKITNGQSFTPTICWHTGTEQRARGLAEQTVNNSIIGSDHTITKRKTWMEKRLNAIKIARMYQ